METSPNVPICLLWVVVAIDGHSSCGSIVGLSAAIAIDRQCDWSVVENNNERWPSMDSRTMYCGRQWLLTDTPRNLWWPAMAIDGRSSTRSIVIVMDKQYR